MKRVVFTASLGLVGCKQVVGEVEYSDEEFEDIVASGAIYDDGFDAAISNYLDVTYEVEDV